MSFIINTVNNAPPLPIYIAGPILLSSSDILNLASTPKLLIPAPGSGFANIPFETWNTSSSGTAYSGGGNLALVNGSNVAITPSNNIFIALAGTSLFNSIANNVTGATVATYTNLNNQAIYLFNTNSAYTGGTQTAKIWIKYYIQPLV